VKASRRYLFWKIGERTSPSSCGFDHPPAPRAREGQRNLDLNFFVVICLRPIIAFRLEITELCRFSAIRARCAFGNNFDCANRYERRGNGVR
jgi:hypothetical protein